MLIWNLAVNLIPDTNWEILAAYAIYTATAQGIMTAGRLLKAPLIRWGGWFFLLFTLVHFLFVNLWLIDRPFQLAVLFLIGSSLILNRDLCPRFR